MREDQSPPPSPRPGSTHTNKHIIYATGGGAHKFEEALSTVLGLVYQKVGEFDSLALGLRYLLQYHPEGVYTINEAGLEEQSADSIKFPCAVCNIGSGVSVLKVDKEGRHERMGGTSIGGSTFLGLCRLSAKASTFEEALELARRGDASGVDTTVEDIYGSGCEVLGIPGDAPAASFGKLVSGDAVEAKNEDIAASILSMVTQAIQQIAFGLAQQGECQSLIFTGGFLRGNELSQRNLSRFARMRGGKALFLKHAEYAGAIGCLLKVVEKKRRQEEQNDLKKARRKPEPTKQLSDPMEGL